MTVRKEDTGKESDEAQGRRRIWRRIVKLGKLDFGHFMLQVNAVFGQKGGSHFEDRISSTVPRLTGLYNSLD